MAPRSALPHLVVGEDLGDRPAAEDRREGRRDGAGRVGGGAGRGRGTAGEVRADHVGGGRVLNRRERELAALLLRRARRWVVGDRLAAEGVVAVVAREDLALGARVEAADREWLQIAVAAVRGE